MPAYLNIVLLAIPIIFQVGTVILLRETPTRSRHAATFVYTSNVRAGSLVVLFTAVILYSLSSHDRSAVFYGALTVLALAGSELTIHVLFRTFTHITRSYLDPAAWLSLTKRKSHWRYEMRRRFVDDPEYIDALTIELIQGYATWDEFEEALRTGQYPESYEPLLDKRVWGVLQPTVRELASTVIPNELFRNTGRYSSGHSPTEIYDELRNLVNNDRAKFMDRLQYYWCLRNLNYIDRLVSRLINRATCIAAVLTGAFAFGLAATMLGMLRMSMDLALRAEAAGTVLWLLCVTTGASILIVRIFQGTGTFSISTPCRSKSFDPLWSWVIRVGILAFSASFIVYGMGSPVLLDPSVLYGYHIHGTFVVYAALSFTLCIAVFLTHSVGLHDLMLGSRNNALDKITGELDKAPDNAARGVLFERFREVRSLQAWPLRWSTLAQVGAGILVPVAVQVILLYMGLRSK